MSTLIEKLLKSSTIKDTALINDSKVFGKKDSIVTDVPLLNVALSGSLDGGLQPGLLTVAGPSKHFKTAFSLIIASAFQKKYKDGIILFYDSEFGSPESYFKNFDIDMDRVIHTPILNAEEFKFDIAKQLENIEKKDNVLILVDSVGNLASKKEAEDALEGKSVADMSRAKQLKSIFRIVTPHLNMKNIPMIVVNHTYQTQEIYSKAVVSGGTGIYYSSADIWIIGRSQEKDNEGISGYNFTIRIEKSRRVREGKKIPIHVSFDGGIDKYSGLFDLALKHGYIHKPSMGWYNKIDLKTGEIGEKKYRQKEFMDDTSFFDELIKDKNFNELIKSNYSYDGKPKTDQPMEENMLEDE